MDSERFIDAVNAALVSSYNFRQDSHTVLTSVCMSVCLMQQFDEYPQDEMVQSVNNLVRNFLTSAMPGGECPTCVDVIVTQYTSSFSSSSSFFCSSSGSSLPVRQLPPVVKGLADDSRGGFPLSFVHTPFYTKPRIVLVG